MVRRLIWAGLGLCALWCLWWGVAAFGLRAGIDGWLQARASEGWQAERQDVALSGFPNRVEARYQGLAVADPTTGLAYEFDDLTLGFRTIWPGDLQVALPESPITLATPEGTWRLLATEGQADLNTHPGPSLELENLSLSTGPFRVEDRAGALEFGGSAMKLYLRQLDSAESYKLVLDADEFSPGDKLRDLLSLNDEFAKIFETLQVEADIRLDAPINRAALESRRPQPMQIDIKLADAKWGDIRLAASGSVMRDGSGFAEGQMVVKAENWQKMLDIAVGAGVLPAQYLPQATAMLSGLASGTGRTDELDLTLTFKGGLTRIGFIPLGPAPSLVIR